MPRKRQTMSGDDAQNIGSVPGRRYGEGVEQQAMQRAMPAPDRAGAPVAPAVATGVPEGAAPPTAQMDPQAVQQFLSGGPNLLAGTQNMDEPVTSGLSQGPGAGPDALKMLQSSTPLRRYLTQLSEQSGDPTFARLAERAGL